MKINKQAGDIIEFAIKENAKQTTSTDNIIKVKNEVITKRPKKDDPIEIKVQYNLSLPYIDKIPVKLLSHPDFDHIRDSWNQDMNKNINKDTFDCNKDERLIWWNHSCGHIYKMSVQDRVSKKTKCKLCSYKNLKEYNFLFNNWDEDANGKLIKFPNIKGSYGWKCDIGHYYIKIFKSMINNSSCPECDRIAREEKAKELLNKINFYGSSFIERKIYFFIKCIFPEALNGHKINGREIDIFVPSLNFGIEYDGSFYHRDIENLERDKNKNIELNKLGIRLLRIREQPLDKLFPQDILFNYQTHNLNELMNDVFSFIKQIHPLHKSILIGMDNFMKGDLNKMPIPQEFLLPIPLGESLGFNYPHLVSFWNEDMNTEFNLFQVRYNSTILNKKAWWKCDKCNSQWSEKISDRIPEKIPCYKCHWKGY